MSVLVGKPAPEFDVKAVVNGGEVVDSYTLSSLKGKYVVLFFYPLDFTFVCPTELHAFQEKLEAFDFQESPIYARRGLRKNSWGSSVLLLDCNQLQHWSLKSFIHSLHEGTIDYDDLMNLKLEKSVSQLENKWNEFDEIKKDTILLHTTERITQPWRAGLKLNSSIKPILRIFPRAPIYRILGKDLTKGREHPSKKVAEFFFKELSKCVSENCISMDEIDLAIERKFLREDIKEKIAFK